MLFFTQTEVKQNKKNKELHVFVTADSLETNENKSINFSFSLSKNQRTKRCEKKGNQETKGTQ